MSKSIKIQVIKSFEGQAVDSKTVEVTDIEKFASEVSKDLSYGYDFDLKIGGTEIAFRKPMPAAYIEQEIGSRASEEEQFKSHLEVLDRVLARVKEMVNIESQEDLEETQEIISDFYMAGYQEEDKLFDMVIEKLQG